MTTYIIKNTAYPDRVADLYGAQANRPIIGYHLNNGVNQKVYTTLINCLYHNLTFESQWTLHPAGSNTYKLSTKSSGGATVYADNVYPAEVSCTMSIITYHNMNVSKDDDIFGTSTDTIYTLTPPLGSTDANHKYRLFRLLPAMYLRCCFRISVKSSSGEVLYWTLDNVAERTKVRLTL